MQKLTLKVLCRNWADGYYVKTDLKGITQKNWAEKYSATTELKGIMQNLSWKVLCKNWAERYYAATELKGIMQNLSLKAGPLSQTATLTVNRWLPNTPHARLSTHPRGWFCEHSKAMETSRCGTQTRISRHSLWCPRTKGSCQTGTLEYKLR